MDTIDPKSLKQRVAVLEERIRQLESQLAGTPDSSDKDYMDALYAKARDLVIKNNKASILFLQKKLLIDFTRASHLLDRLEADEVIGPDMGALPRRILVKE